MTSPTTFASRRRPDRAGPLRPAAGRRPCPEYAVAPAAEALPTRDLAQLTPETAAALEEPVKDRHPSVRSSADLVGRTVNAVRVRRTRRRIPTILGRRRG